VPKLLRIFDKET